MPLPPPSLQTTACLPAAKRLLLVLLSACGLAHGQSLAAEELEVLHWWTAKSEQMAAEVLWQAAERQGFTLTDIGISGGAGEGAVKVLKARILLGDAPALAQIIGPTIREWAALDFFHSLNDIATNNAWYRSLPDPIFELVSHQQQAFAVPLAVHRINTQVYHPGIFEQLQLAPATDWDDFIDQLQRIQAAGHWPLAHVNQAWQNATLFEIILAATAEPGTYWQIMVEQDQERLLGPEMALALERLRDLKTYMQPLSHQNWQAASQQVVEGKAAMQLMGDWAWAELQQITPEPMGCQAFFRQHHIFSLDSLVFFAQGGLNATQAQQLAHGLMQPEVLSEFARLKGAVPAHRQARADYNACQAQSAQDFHQAIRLPSLVHRATAREEVRNVFIHAIHRFFNDDQQSISATQARLAAELKALQ